MLLDLSAAVPSLLEKEKNKLNDCRQKKRQYQVAEIKKEREENDVTYCILGGKGWFSSRDIIPYSNPTKSVLP